eukprot:1099174_1
MQRKEDVSSQRQSIHIMMRNYIVLWWSFMGILVRLTTRGMYLMMPKQVIIVLVNAMMKALNKNAHSEQALAIYEQYEYIHDDVSHLTAIKACVMSRNYTKGQAIHSTVGSDCDIFIQTAFIDFYGTFHQIQKAQNIFTSIENINTVCVNAMLKAYSNNDMFDKLLQLYDATQGQCLHDDISHLLALKGCIRLNAFEEGQRIHLTYIH